MSQLSIADLSFFESKFSGENEIKGGGKKRSKVSIAYDTGSATAYKVDYKIVGGVATYKAAAAAASGAAAAVSLDGSLAKAKVKVDAKVD